MLNLKKIIQKDFFFKNKKLSQVSFIDLSENKKNYSDTLIEKYKRYPKIQLDSFNKLKINKNRFYQNSQWQKYDLKNKNILEIGSGAGKFTEILLQTNCNLITTDVNDSIKVNYKNNFKKRYLKKVCFIKENIDQVIFKKNIFDYIVLYGVLQNVDKQKNLIKKCIYYLKKGGKLTLDVTKGNKFYLHLINPKFFWRMIFKRMSTNNIYKIVNFLVPKFISLDTFLKKNLNGLGRVISKIIFPFPLINYYFLPLKNQMKLKMSILDTFDGLASKFDKPLTVKALKNMIKSIENELNLKFTKVEIIEQKKLIILNVIL